MRLIENVDKYDHYKMLGLKKDASADAIKQAYRKLARDFHPDVFYSEATEKMKPHVADVFTRIKKAFDVLSIHRKRQEYDLSMGHIKETDEMRAIKRKKARANMQYKIALNAMKQRQFTKAIDFLKSAIDIDPSEAFFYGKLAEVYSKNPRWYRVGKEACEDAIEREPGNPEFYITYGQILKSEGLIDQAKNNYFKALQLNPYNEEALQEMQAIDKSFDVKQLERIDTSGGGELIEKK